MEGNLDCPKCGRKEGKEIEEDEGFEEMEEPEDCCCYIPDGDIMELIVLGNDVIALFPSLTSKRTGQIIREQVLKSKMKYEGFDFKEIRRYVAANRELTGDLKCLEDVLPRRKSLGKGGRKPTIKSAEIYGKEKGTEKTWIFPKRAKTGAGGQNG